jgi:hypothetical protein
MRKGSVSCAVLGALFASCSSPVEDDGGAPPQACVGEIPVGSATGHADPFGAKAAKQSRAGVVAKAAGIVQPAHGRQQIHDGDYVLANDRLAVFIQKPGLNDGYGRFGGAIVSLDEVGADGKPLGRSRYNESLATVGAMMPNIRSVTVLNDGSDGKAAIVRAVGKLQTMPYLEGSLAKLLPTHFDLDVAYDYLLAPGSEKVALRMVVRNAAAEDVDLGTATLYGFFQTSFYQVATEGAGFGPTAHTSPWIGFVGGRAPAGVDAGGWNYAWRAAGGSLTSEVGLGTFYLFSGPGVVAKACAITNYDRAEVIAGGPELDGLREAIRRVDGAPAWRALTGVVKDAQGNPVAGALVHELDAKGAYLSRAAADAAGKFTIHAPPGQAVKLVATARGYWHDGSDVAAEVADATLSFGPTSRIHVTAEDDQGRALPVRIQIIPEKPLPAYPVTFGVEQETNGRLHQIFDADGDATAVVPPGKNRIIVTRGYEYELHDETVDLAAGEQRDLKAVLAHSVDSTGVMCGDFHIHTQLSVDATDPVDFKVLGAVADGLDIPCSSDHEWVFDFGPVVKKLGLEKWAFGMSSSELSTSSWGHFGIIPLTVRPERYNHGAIDWIGLTPAQMFAAAHALPEKPAVVVNHPRKANIGGYFASALWDPDLGIAHDAALWSPDFDALEVFNDDSFDGSKNVVKDWVSLLLHGKRVFAIGNSDSHTLRTQPVGYPRTCFAFGHDDPQKLTPAAVRDAILAGNSVVSAGLMMTVAGPGGAKPGAMVAAGKQTFTVTVEAPSWIKASEIEALVDGVVVDKQMAAPLGMGPSNRYVNAMMVDLTGKHFVMFHARSAQDLAPLHPGKTPFAVSNPIFVK